MIAGWRALAAALLLGTALAAAAEPRLAWLQSGRLVFAGGAGVAGESAEPLRTPLGSSWKLFVYAYLHERGAAEPPYRCAAGERRSDEEYCCDPGQAVARDAALARSCGRYFEPQRLAIAAGDWQAFWRAQAAPEWLQSLAAMAPETSVGVAALLQAAGRIPGGARQAARSALLPNTLRDAGVLDALGSGPRFKTWSWSVAGRRAGGALGWLADGTPFWFGADGSSRSALGDGAAWIAAQWRAAGLAPSAADDHGCVQVAMFSRYPLRAVRSAGGAPAADGPLRGRHELQFANGQSLTIDALPVLRLVHEGGRPLIRAEFALEDYVARVVDREGDAREPAAARALAVAARSWLLQNAGAGRPCRTTVDDSRAQRVSPQPPSVAARAAAAFTEGLVLQGEDVRYHLDAGAPGVMSWQGALAASRAGRSFEQILRDAFPRASLAGIGSASACEAMAEAQHWLLQRERSWRAILQAQVGYEPPAADLQVCRLAYGTPYSDQRRLEIHTREWSSREGRVTLIHEYLHLAFRHHPRGRDEAFVERLAQQLADT